MAFPLRYCTLAVLILFPLTARAQAPQLSFEDQAMADLSRLNESESLGWDAYLLWRVIQVDRPEVLPALLDVYRKPPARPQNHLRYLAVAALRDRYDPHRLGGAPITHQGATLPLSLAGEAGETLYDFAFKEIDHEMHLWAGAELGAVLVRDDRFRSAILELAGKERRTFRRVAAIEALVEAGQEEVLPLLDEILTSRKLKKADRMLLVEAAAWGVARLCRSRLAPDSPASEAEQAAAVETLEHVIELLNDRKLLPRTQVQLRRALQHALETAVEHPDPGTWRQVLAARGGGRAGHRSVARFMGIEVTGNRILFILDASDSMLNPLSEEEKQKLLALAPSEPVRSGSQSRGGRPDPFAIEWQAIETRFDAARAHLKLTLRMLDEEQHFAVVLFGNEARLLEATPAFVPAKKKVVYEAYQALDAVPIGAPNTSRKYGTLMGQTNIHGAFELGYRLGARGLAKPDTFAYVDVQLLVEGPDTIFCLTDGKPTLDSYTGLTPAKQIGGYWIEAREYDYQDPETGETRRVKQERRYIPERVQRLSHHGPYRMDHWLLRDLRRMNLIRRARIHAIALGESGRNLPAHIAELGGGSWVDLTAGDDEDEEDPDGKGRAEEGEE